ncbi:MAG: hypothetical protein A2Z25_07825 [Planctomycetes bacterium RBG_16_55_9]|nr:MAG: hypothetical protein A2Z25_07825 [Planctomycetes bacterium RBG_16_55_9]
MKAWLLVITAALLVAIFSSVGRSAESPVMRNPAGYGTLPPSTYRDGLVNNPNPIDATGNLLVTGNVRRGMYFRGTVPYRSTTSFSAPLGSSALDSFLRDTAGSEDFAERSNKYRVQPYYSPTQTVTTMVPGKSEVFGPMGVRIDDRIRPGTAIVTDGLLGLDALPRVQASPDQDAAAGDSDFQELQRRYHPLVEPPSTLQTPLSGVSLSSRQMEPLVPGQLGIRLESDVLVDGAQDRTQDAMGLARDSDQDSQPGFADPQRRRNRPAREGLVQYPDEELSVENRKSRPEMREQAGSTESGDLVKPGADRSRSDGGYDSVAPSDVTLPEASGQDRREVLELIREQLDALTKSIETGLREDEAGTGISGTDTQRQEALSPSQDGVGLRDASRPYQPARADSRLNPAGAGEAGILSTVSSLDELRQRGTPVLSANAERMKEPHGSLESFTQSRFNKHISDAEEHLKAGRYYRAADSFTLAAVYQPDNPVVLAGRGHALFAAGEYMSSALFLARALAIQPDYLQATVDLAAVLGGADKLAARTADVEQWLARSGAPQLQFLLSYVYFRTGRLDQARQAIAEAHKKMPDSPAVEVMRTAINQVSPKQ